MGAYWSTIIGAVTVVGITAWVLNNSKSKNGAFPSLLASTTAASNNIERAFSGN